MPGVHPVSVKLCPLITTRSHFILTQRRRDAEFFAKCLFPLYYIRVLITTRSNFILTQRRRVLRRVFRRVPFSALLYQSPYHHTGSFYSHAETQRRRVLRRVFRRAMVVVIGVLGVSDRSGRLCGLNPENDNSAKNSAPLRERKKHVTLMLLCYCV